jgi:hypothetical protein
MLFAQALANSPSEIAFAVAFAIVGWVIIIWIGMKIYRRFNARATSVEMRVFDSLLVSAEAQKGWVQVHFHTYSGLLVFVTQREYRFWAEPEDARMALWRLHKFNCTEGLLAYCGLIIPILSYANYLAQKRSIRKQSGLAKQRISELA